MLMKLRNWAALLSTKQCFLTKPSMLFSRRCLWHEKPLMNTARMSNIAIKFVCCCWSRMNSTLPHRNRVFRGVIEKVYCSLLFSLAVCAALLPENLRAQEVAPRYELETAQPCITFGGPLEFYPLPHRGNDDISELATEYVSARYTAIPTAVSIFESRDPDGSRLLVRYDNGQCILVELPAGTQNDIFLTTGRILSSTSWGHAVRTRSIATLQRYLCENRSSPEWFSRTLILERSRQSEGDYLSLRTNASSSDLLQTECDSEALLLENSVGLYVFGSDPHGHEPVLVLPTAGMIIIQ